MRKALFPALVVAATLGALLCGPAANAAMINSVVNGKLIDLATWDADPGRVPTVGDTAYINHTVQMDYNTTAEGDEVWDADVVQINSGGTLDGRSGKITVNALIFNGGSMVSSQNDGTHNATSVTINDVAGNRYTNTKNLRNTTLNTQTISGSGTLGLVLSHAKTMTFNVTDPSGTAGFTGLFDATFEDRATSINKSLESNQGNVKFTHSIAEEDASFGLVFRKFIYDWTGGAGADDGTAYTRLDVRTGSGDGSELWFTSLQLGDFVVPSRATAYTYAELVGLNAANASFLLSDGTDAMVGVVPEPATLGLLAIGGLFVLRRRRRA